jgi:hypothetical protein
MASPGSRSSDFRSRDSRSPASPSSLERFERDGFVAELRSSMSRALGVEIFHYIIQRTGSRDIVHWGQELSRQQAMDCVDEFIGDQKRITAAS